MANPQLEDGYIRIANEVWQRLRQLNLSSTEWKILLYVIEKTWGFHKKEAPVSLLEFSKNCGCTKRSANKILNEMISKKIILKQKDSVQLDATPKASIYGFNKDFDEWTASKRTLASNEVLRQRPTETRTISKDNIKISNRAHAHAHTPARIIGDLATPYSECLSRVTEASSIKSAVPPFMLSSLTRGISLSDFERAVMAACSFLLSVKKNELTYRTLQKFLADAPKSVSREAGRAAIEEFDKKYNTNSYAPLNAPAAPITRVRTPELLGFSPRSTG